MFRLPSARIPQSTERFAFAADEFGDVEGGPNVGRVALTLFAAAGFAMSVVAARAQIVRIAPYSAALFEALGLQVNLAKLDIARATARIVADGERRFLVVDGEVANSGSEIRTVPPMRVSVRSADRQSIYTWTTNPTRQKIEPGERAAFSARLAAPPADGADVVVEFDRAGDSPAHRTPKTTAVRRYQGSRTESQ